MEEFVNFEFISPDQHRIHVGEVRGLTQAESTSLLQSTKDLRVNHAKSGHAGKRSEKRHKMCDETKDILVDATFPSNAGKFHGTHLHHKTGVDTSTFQEVRAAANEATRVRHRVPDGDIRDVFVIVGNKSGQAQLNKNSAILSQHAMYGRKLKDRTGVQEDRHFSSAHGFRRQDWGGSIRKDPSIVGPYKHSLKVSNKEYTEWMTDVEGVMKQQVNMVKPYVAEQLAMQASQIAISASGIAARDKCSLPSSHFLSVCIATDYKGATSHVDTGAPHLLPWKPAPCGPFSHN